MNFSMLLDNTEKSHETVSWVLYLGTVLSIIFGLIPDAAWVSLLLALPIALVARWREHHAAHTIYTSHMGNVFLVGIASCMVSLFLIIKMMMGLALGSFITIPAAVAMFIWGVYRVVKGALALLDKRAFS